jgi:hypothetical protein
VSLSTQNFAPNERVQHLSRSRRQEKLTIFYLKQLKGRERLRNQGFGGYIIKMGLIPLEYVKFVELTQHGGPM